MIRPCPFDWVNLRHQISQPYPIPTELDEGLCRLKEGIIFKLRQRRASTAEFLCFLKEDICVKGSVEVMKN